MKTQHIVGTLIPKEPEVITSEIRHSIHEALVINGLVGVFSADRCAWDNAVVINHVSEAEKGNHSPLDFIKGLNEVLWRVLAAGLRLDGEVTITVTGTDPVVYRVKVEDSELSYKHATLLWNKDISSI